MNNSNHIRRQSAMLLQRHYSSDGRFSAPISRGVYVKFPEQYSHHGGRPSSQPAPLREFHVTIGLSDEALAVNFEWYLKCGSGRAFAKRHFG